MNIIPFTGVTSAWPLWLALSGLAVLLLCAARLHRSRPETVAIIGAGPEADRMVRALNQRGARRAVFLGVFDDRGTRAGSGTLAISGPVSDLIELGKARSIDWVLLALPATADLRIASMVHQLKSLAVSVGVGDAQSMPLASRYVAGQITVRLLAERPIRLWGAAAKGIEDYVVTALLTLALLPLMALIALAIRIESPGPVLFKQRRHAWNNAEFEVYKFRSMRWNAGAQTQPLMQTARNDARITRLGRFLRRTSLDELPQLFNVLRGEMSLVGPRPHAVNMLTEDRLSEEIVKTYAHRHRVKPGLTGWAQVNGYRGAMDTARHLRRRTRLDLQYIENWSFWFDLKILAMTARIVVKGTNAY